MAEQDTPVDAAHGHLPLGLSLCSQATSTPRLLEINFSDNIRMFKALKPQCFVLLSLSEHSQLV